MTTILIDMASKTMYSDSLTTITTTENWISTEIHKTDIPKLFKHKNGKMIASVSGAVSVTFKILEELGFDVPEKICGKSRSTINNRGERGSVLILNQFNDTCTHIYREYDHKGKLKEDFKEYFCYKPEQKFFLTMGSGGDIANKIYKKTNCPLRAMRYAGMIDKFSDTNIKIIKL